MYAQTVEIPADHRVIIEAPREIPIHGGQTEARGSWRSLYGICKGVDTLSAFLERKHAEKEREFSL